MARRKGPFVTKTDRRVERTRELLQKALIDLFREQGYAAITIQDIADRANVGRTTFYLHYSSKDDLFLSCHEALISTFAFGPHSLRSRTALLSREAPPGMIAAYRHLAEARTWLEPLLQGKDSLLILRRIRAGLAQEIEASLRAAFAEADSRIPLDVLAVSLAGAQITLVQWWLEQRQPHTPENLAEAFQRVQRAVIRDAFGLPDA